jgi:uncharacterized protein YukE
VPYVYSNLSLDTAKAYLGGGEVASLNTAADRFGAAAKELATVLADLTQIASSVSGGDFWQGPAADTFVRVVNELRAFVAQVHEAGGSYDPLLRTAGNALTAANELLQNAASTTKVTDFAGAVNQAAGPYITIMKAMPAIPTTPKSTAGGGGKKEEDEKEDEKDPTGPEEDAGGGGPEEEAGGGGPEEDAGGGPEEDAGGMEPESDEAGGMEPESGGAGGPDPLGDSSTEDPGLGTDASAEDSGDGEPGGTGSGTPGKEAPTDADRALDGAPVVVGPDGTKGIDVDGDGRPDLGIDGTPLRGPDGELLHPDKLVTYAGVQGIDVNGDHRPDIGVDGEILPWAPIVEGPDGTIGIDVDEDGLPDIAISGQILPDAPIVTTADGVRGIDVNGDGVPELGMDRRPLAGAATVTVDGVTGVDVNNDGRPDIGMDGSVLPHAPLVTGANGIVGVDVGVDATGAGDGKPDIAVPGGLVADRGAAAGVTRAVGLSELSASGQIVTRGLTVADPQTTLAAIASSSPAVALPTRGYGGGVEYAPMGGAYLGGGYLGGSDLDDDVVDEPWGVHVVASADTWVDEGPRTSVLGRDKPTTGWEEQRR